MGASSQQRRHNSGRPQMSGPSAALVSPFQETRDATNWSVSATRPRDPQSLRVPFPLGSYRRTPARQGSHPEDNGRGGAGADTRTMGPPPRPCPGCFRPFWAWAAVRWSSAGNAEEGPGARAATQRLAWPRCCALPWDMPGAPPTAAVLEAQGSLRSNSAAGSFQVAWQGGWLLLKTFLF